jgi:hypothetical protein
MGGGMDGDVAARTTTTTRKAKASRTIRPMNGNIRNPKCMATIETVYRTGIHSDS